MRRRYRHKRDYQFLRGYNMPINYKDYPDNWSDIRNEILDRANNCCEGSPGYFPDCRAKNYTNHPVTGSKVVLTIAHLDHDTRNNDLRNLKSMCQRCHNVYDSDYRRQNRATNKRKALIKMGQMEFNL